MLSFMDAKILAKNLRKSLASKAIEQSHSECLELVAQQFGLNDWNQLSARIATTAERATKQAPAMPRGWTITRQTDRATYRIGMDDEIHGAAQVACCYGREDGIALPADSYGVMMQSIDAAPYRGRKMALEALLTTDDADAASIWMRVDQALGQVLRFDNMLDRSGEGALQGTKPWTSRRIVLDIPEGAASLHFGLLLHGYGRVRVKDLTLREAQGEWPVTAANGKLLMEPTNLNFESAA